MELFYHVSRGLLRLKLPDPNHLIKRKIQPISASIPCRIVAVFVFIGNKGKRKQKCVVKTNGVRQCYKPGRD